MDKTMIITDLDGTLLNNQNEISSENAKWIKKFRDLGGLFTFATGRVEKSILPYAKELELDLPIISYNGARVYCPITGNIIFERELTIPIEIWELITNIEQEVGVFIYQEGKAYTLNDNQIVKEFEEKEKMKFEKTDIERFINKAITKVLIIMNMSTPLVNIDVAIRQSKYSCETVFSEVNYLEILPLNTSKGRALLELEKQLNKEDLFTIGLGDNLNDISLLNEVKLGIAVKNAHPKLKQVADVISEQSNNEDAVAFAIKNLLNQVAR